MQKKNLVLGLIALVMVIASGLLIGSTLEQRQQRTAERVTDVPTQTPVPTVIAALPTDVPSTDTASPTPTVTPSTTPAILANVPAAAVTLAPTVIPSITPTPAPELGEAVAIVDPPTYMADGRWAEVNITVKNISVPTGVATGYTYLVENPDGGTQYVTAFGVDHQEVPQAIITDGAPLWRGHVIFSDGEEWWFPAGCFYIETIDANGWEPIGGPDGFYWTVHWTGGFFDCGNSTNKLPQQPLLMPGEQATTPMYVYLQHPRLWDDPDWPPPDRAIVYIGIEVFDGLGRSLGIIGSLDWR